MLSSLKYPIVFSPKGARSAVAVRIWGADAAQATLFNQYFAHYWNQPAFLLALYYDRAQGSKPTDTVILSNCHYDEAKRQGSFTVQEGTQERTIHYTVAQAITAFHAHEKSITQDYDIDVYDGRDSPYHRIQAQRLQTIRQRFVQSADNPPFTVPIPSPENDFSNIDPVLMKIWNNVSNHPGMPRDMKLSILYRLYRQCMDTLTEPLDAFFNTHHQVVDQRASGRLFPKISRDFLEKMTAPLIMKKEMDSALLLLKEGYFMDKKHGGCPHAFYPVVEAIYQLYCESPDKVSDTIGEACFEFMRAYDEKYHQQATPRDDAEQGSVIFTKAAQDFMTQHHQSSLRWEALLERYAAYFEREKMAFGITWHEPIIITRSEMKAVPDQGTWLVVRYRFHAGAAQELALHYESLESTLFSAKQFLVDPTYAIKMPVMHPQQETIIAEQNEPQDTKELISAYNRSALERVKAYKDKVKETIKATFSEYDMNVRIINEQHFDAYFNVFRQHQTQLTIEAADRSTHDVIDRHKKEANTELKQPFNDVKLNNLLSNIDQQFSIIETYYETNEKMSDPTEDESIVAFRLSITNLYLSAVQEQQAHIKQLNACHRTLDENCQALKDEPKQAETSEILDGVAEEAYQIERESDADEMPQHAENLKAALTTCMSAVHQAMRLPLDNIEYDLSVFLDEAKLSAAQALFTPAMFEYAVSRNKILTQVKRCFAAAELVTWLSQLETAAQIERREIPDVTVLEKDCRAAEKQVKHYDGILQKKKWFYRWTPEGAAAVRERNHYQFQVEMYHRLKRVALLGPQQDTPPLQNINLLKDDLLFLAGQRRDCWFYEILTKRQLDKYMTWDFEQIQRLEMPDRIENLITRLPSIQTSKGERSTDLDCAEQELKNAIKTLATLSGAPIKQLLKNESLQAIVKEKTVMPSPKQVEPPKEDPVTRRQQGWLAFMDSLRRMAWLPAHTQAFVPANNLADKRLSPFTMHMPSVAQLKYEWQATHRQSTFKATVEAPPVVETIPQVITPVDPLTPSVAGAALVQFSKEKPSVKHKPHKRQAVIEPPKAPLFTPMPDTQAVSRLGLFTTQSELFGPRVTTDPVESMDLTDNTPQLATKGNRLRATLTQLWR